MPGEHQRSENPEALKNTPSGHPGYLGTRALLSHRVLIVCRRLFALQSHGIQIAPAKYLRPRTPGLNLDCLPAFFRAGVGSIQLERNV